MSIHGPHMPAGLEVFLSERSLAPSTADWANTQVHLVCFLCLPRIKFPSTSLALFSLSPMELPTSRWKMPSLLYLWPEVGEWQLFSNKAHSFKSFSAIVLVLLALETSTAPLLFENQENVAKRFCS